MSVEDLQLWDRQPGEPPRAWAAFQVYRDAGPETRSIAFVCQQCGKTRGLVTRWCGAYQWVRRAAAWDDSVDRDRQQKQREDILSMNMRHAATASIALSKVIERLGQLTEPDLQAMKFQDIARMLEVAVRVERQARGEPGDTVQQVGGAQTADLLRKLSTDELRQMEGLLRKAHDGGTGDG